MKLYLHILTWFQDSQVSLKTTILKVHFKNFLKSQISLIACDFNL